MVALVRESLGGNKLSLASIGSTIRKAFQIG